MKKRVAAAAARPPCGLWWLLHQQITPVQAQQTVARARGWLIILLLSSPTAAANLMNKSNFFSGHYSVFGAVVSGWCELSFFIIWDLGGRRTGEQKQRQRRESSHRLTAARSRGGATEKGKGLPFFSFFFLSGIVILIPGSDFVPILGGLIIFLIPPLLAWPGLRFSFFFSPQPQEDQLRFAAAEAIPACSCSCSAPHESSSTTRPQVIFPPIFLLPSAPPPPPTSAAAAAAAENCLVAACSSSLLRSADENFSEFWWCSCRFRFPGGAALAFFDYKSR